MRPERCGLEDKTDATLWGGIKISGRLILLFMDILPSSGISSPVIRRRRVVFPLPEGPRMAHLRLIGIVKETGLPIYDRKTICLHH